MDAQIVNSRKQIEYIAKINHPWPYGVLGAAE
jgi:hypothetical protein